MNQISRIPHFGVIVWQLRALLSEWQPEFQGAKTIYHRIEVEQVGPQETMKSVHSSEKRSTLCSERESLNKEGNILVLSYSQ